MLTFTSLFFSLSAIFINVYALMLCVSILEKWHEFNTFTKVYGFIGFFVHVICIAINIPPLLY